jgi:bacterioferritin-associated ferredoxin
VTGKISRGGMIICSCNVISDHEVRDAAQASATAEHMSEVYRRLGRVPQCGRCKTTIKTIVGATHQRPDAG